MSVHRGEVNLTLLDRLAAEVLRAAVVFERAVHEANRYDSTKTEADALCAAAKSYREAVLEEVLADPGGA